MIQPQTISQLRELETPFYFYDLDLLRKTLEKVDQESNKDGCHVHYAVKANANDAVLKTIFASGFGADCVSGNEISKAVEMGVSESQIAFAGVGKTDKGIAIALENNTFSFNVESLPELEVTNEVAGKMAKTASVAIRINPNVDPKTHEYESTDVFAKAINLPEFKRGDLLTIHSAGAYGEVMASTYNLRNLVKSFNSDQLQNG